MASKTCLLAMCLIAMLIFSSCSPSRELIQESSAKAEETVLEKQKEKSEVPQEAEPLSQTPEPQEETELTEKPEFYKTMELVQGWYVFRLSSAQDLKDLAKWINDGANTTNVIFAMENDIDLAQENFVPIGSVEHPFKGVFLGQNYKITGLNVRVEEKNIPAGFFGALGGEARVDRLHVEGEVTGIDMVGGFAGTAGQIETSAGSSVYPYVQLNNCSFTGQVNGVMSDVGGFVGSTGENARITGCFADAQVCGQESVGGFVGLISKNALVLQSYSLGQVSAADRDYWIKELKLPSQEDWGTQSSEEEIYVRFIGGFSGMQIGTAFECYSSADIKTLQPAKTVGAFVGYCSGRVIQSYYTLENNSQWKPGYAVESGGAVEAQGLTAEQMGKQDSFVSWDFQSIWQMDEKGRPVFIEQPQVSLESYLDSHIINPWGG